MVEPVLFIAFIYFFHFYFLVLPLPFAKYRNIKKKLAVIFMSDLYIVLKMSSTNTEFYLD